jgi:hypothetical protein
MKRSIPLKAKMEQLFNRFRKPKIVIVRRSLYYPDGLIRIPVPRSGKREG